MSSWGCGRGTAAAPRQGRRRPGWAGRERSRSRAGFRPSRLRPAGAAGALAADGLSRYVADLETALASSARPWQAYTECLHRVIDGRSQELAQRLAGTFTPIPELTALAGKAARLADTLFRRARSSGELRDDVSEADIVLLLEAIMLVKLPGPDQGNALRHRYLDLLLQALHAPAEAKLPGSPARQADLAARWRPGSHPARD